MQTREEYIAEQMAQNGAVEQAAAKTEAAQTEETKPAGEEQQQENQGQQPFYTKYGEFKDESEFDSFIGQAKELHTQRESITQKQQEIENRISYLSEVDADPDPEITTIANFKKKGIGIDIATRIISTSAEQLEADPLNALILAEAVLNPSKFSKLGDKGVEQAVREKYNQPEEGEYTVTALMRSDAIDAIEKINKVKSEVADSKNPITFAKEQVQQRQSSFKNNVEQTAKIFDEVISSIDNVEEKFGDVDLSFKVSKEDQQWLNSQKEAVAAQFANAPADLKKQQIATYLTSMLKVQRYMNGEAFKAWESTYAAAAERKGTQAAFNGTAITPNRVTDHAESKDESPFRKAARERGLIQ